MPNPNDLTPQPTPQTWKEYFTSPAFVHQAVLLIGVAMSVAIAQLNSCKTDKNHEEIVATKADVKTVAEVQKAAAPAAAQSQLNTAKLVSNLEGNTPEAKAKVEEAQKTVEAVKATTQESK